MQRTWSRNDETSPSGGQEESPEGPRSQSSRSRSGKAETTRKEEGEQETCWDRLMDRLMPAHLETEPLVKDPVRQEQMKWSIFALTWIAWILGMCSIWGCTFMKVGESHLKFGKLDAFGLFREPVYDDDHTNLGCINYQDEWEKDKGFKLSRISAIIAIISLTIIVFLITSALIFIKNRGMRKVFYWLVRFIVFPTLFFYCLIFIMFGREDCDEPDMKCTPGFSGFVAIINTFVIFIMGMLVIFCPCPEEPFLARYVRRDELPRKDKDDDLDRGRDVEDESPEQPRPITKSKLDDNKNENNKKNDLPKEGLPPNRILVPELGDNDKGVDIKVEKVDEGLKVSQRVTHLDGTKSVTSYVKSTEEPPQLT